MGALFIELLNLHQQYNSDIMIMTSQSASSSRQEKPLCMCSRVMPTHLHICIHPWPTPPYTSLHELLSEFCIPIPMVVILPQVLWCALIPEPVIY